ncbi:hypothetical protein [Powai lake megavirus]|uniref:Eukaryotic translation initiation factor 4E n=1 Tax=Powai lake megavirus TaxID=1842663 RepID=A0A167RJ75_9VIRU|nr:hypothetical protein QJ849_gp586 [Powai lake megavirus]ANB50748.1 hypothetical protein [Powai lake megavirus]WBF70623.1 hypothetical protein [Megavirus caiporensis]
MGIFEVENYIETDTPGLEFDLTNPWIVYHKNLSFKFQTIAGFWSIFKSIPQGHITVQRENFVTDITKNNINNINNTTNSNLLVINMVSNNNKNTDIAFVKCLLGLIGETFSTKFVDSLDIYGISFINEKNSKKIILWISKNVDLQKHQLDIIPSEIKKVVCDPNIYIDSDIYINNTVIKI